MRSMKITAEFDHLLCNIRIRVNKFDLAFKKEKDEEVSARAKFNCFNYNIFRFPAIRHKVGRFLELL